MHGLSAGTFNVRIRDQTNGPTLITRSGTGFTSTAGYYLSGVTTDWERTIILDVDYSPCPTGAITFVVDVSRSGATDISIRDVSLLPEGLF